MVISYLIAEMIKETKKTDLRNKSEREYLSFEETSSVMAHHLEKENYSNGKCINLELQDPNAFNRNFKNTYTLVSEVSNSLINKNFYKNEPIDTLIFPLLLLLDRIITAD